LLKLLLVLGAGLTVLHAAGVVVRFDPSDPQTGPFPSDALTVPDATQATGRRVNLPLPDCDAQPSLCVELALINQLDGFNVQPRVVVRFSGPIDTNTLRNGIQFIALDSGAAIPINYVIYDPATNTAYAKPDSVLAQHSSYALVVTGAVLDRSGDPVGPDPAFTACIQQKQTEYCAGLSPPAGTVAMARFTTLSATSWLESARAQLQNAPIVVQRPPGRNVFDVAAISSLAVNFDLGPGQTASTSLPLDQFAPLLGGLGQIAFASYLSPQFVNAQQIIDPAPTAAGVDLPASSAEISFHAYLPKAAKPANGYPVVIFGHGYGDSSIGGATIVSPVLATAGFATVAINALGHGFGPQSNVVISDRGGNSTTLLLGGRGVDLNGDGAIEASEGCLILAPAAIGLRDCFRQTAVDLMQLVRVLQAGVDLDGDGVADLDGSRIYYVGQSLGSLYGTVLNAVEPGVRAAVMNVGGGSVVDIVRWSQAYQSIGAALLSSQTPPLLPPGTPFNDNYPFRDEPVKVNDKPGQSDVQNFLELLEWLQNPGDPLAFAPRLAPKPVLFQIARADRTMPNPASSELVRAAGMQGSTWLYRHDLALATSFGGQLPQDPHPFLALFLGLGGGSVSVPALPALLIGLAAQSQVADFFTADGAANPDPNQSLFGLQLFEIPAKLPNDLGY
jgi:hypothetical protein